MFNPFRYLIFLVALSLFAVSFGAGFFIGQEKDRVADLSRFDISSLFLSGDVDSALIEDVWDLIHREYVDADNLDDEVLIIGAVRGMLAALDDPYSVFFDAAERSDFLESVNGIFEGVGIEITIRDDKLMIVSPLKNTPAYRAGAHSGDVIVRIDEDTTQGITIEEAVTKIRGPKGTTVVLTVVREDVEEEIELSIVRGTIEVPSVELEIRDDNIAYIELVSFNETTLDIFSLAAQDILNSEADRIILDLRNNPGGFLDVAVNVAGWFLPVGNIVVIEELGDGERRKHTTSGPASLREFPLVVLVNEGSASASEILAGALRDHRGVPLIGATTFGKGSVQSFENLSGGTSLKLTVARWLTPLGAHIEEIGIEPSVVVETNIEELRNDIDKQLDRAVEVVLGL